ncbi:Non-specific polyamine oxidase protein [Dioscorea alata]|uniref:Non-specific polyamine oxidase protein n=1 Tax=Dioscorea alata TaxID=55571 RepID=A0ACB7W2P5_DIOAL|nr:Non-specific polyamine oxidase protein [Dioscorea alata]
MVIKKPRVVIVGAGIAGLTAAHRLYTTNPDLFDLIVVEAGKRIGGRIHTSEFAGDRIEMGATWIHGIHGCPIYEIAKKINAFDHPRSTLYDLSNDNPPTIVIAEGGSLVDPSTSNPILDLFTTLMETVDSRGLPSSAGPGVGSFLRRALNTFLADTLGPDSSLSGEWTVKAMQEAVFALKENVLRVNSSADDLDDLDLNDEYHDFPGEHIPIDKGYSRITEHLAAELPPGTIQLGRKVRLIEWCSHGGGTSPEKAPVRVVLDDESVEIADHVILTVSLGVLKEGLKEEGKAGVSLRFDPGLPSFKKDAIRRLGFGVVDKLFMELDNLDGGKFPFMELDNLDGGKFPFMELVFHPRVHVEKIPWWMRRSPSIWPINGGSRVVYTWFVGKEAEEVEGLVEDVVISGVRATLEGFGAHDNKFVKRVTWTKWGQ